VRTARPSAAAVAMAAEVVLSSVPMPADVENAAIVKLIE
jgi:hypothetical protein